MKRSHRHIILFSLFAILLNACSPTKSLQGEQRLLTHNHIEYDSRSIDKYELEEVLKQRPNKRILGLRFYLSMYNISHPEKIESQRKKKQAKLDKKNERRAEKGKSPKKLKRTTAEWWRDDVGEPPVILDSALTEESRKQLKLYLHKEGFFDAQVQSKVKYPKEKTAEVTYTIQEGEPYTFGPVTYNIGHALMRQIVEEERQESPIVPGKRFDMDILAEERLRLTESFKSQGFYYFSKEYIKMRVDTANKMRQGNIEITLLNPAGTLLREGPATRVYDINKIYVTTQQDDLPPADTLVIDDYSFQFNDRQTVKSKSLLRAIFLTPGRRYSKQSADNTYARLSGLRTFQRIDISFDSTGTGSTDKLNTYVRVFPARQQSVSLEGFGTNRGGFLGTTFSLGYQHKNLFRGMESLDLKLNIGLEGQQRIAGQVSESDGTIGSNDVLFNTLEIGPELTLRFPKFLIPFVGQERFARSHVPRTTLNLLYSFQRRPDFTRILTRGSFGYEWNESRYKQWAVYPIDINEISIPSLTADFQQYLDEANDPVLTDSYTNHFIIGARASYTFNTQDPEKRKRHVWYWRSELETSGNLLRAIFNRTGASSSLDAETGEPFYRINGVRFAQYVKLNNDFRYYRNFHTKSSLVARASFGAGLPLNNLDVLPFETSFFVGGANGLRAWRARSIGPGSFKEPLITFDRIGEIHVEGNLEYRFGLIGFIEGAFFADVGNVWFFEETSNRPGSGFSSNFANELAVGTGFGARLNFDYFLVRFDLGLQTKDPALPQGERWLWQPKEEHEAFISSLTGNDFEYRPVFNFNLGIGYPF